MPRILVTGSSTGLGLATAQHLIGRNHEVILHGRDKDRTAEALAAAAGAAGAITGNLANLAETKSLAEQANSLGPYHAIIHNAGLGFGEPERAPTEEGIPKLFAVNVLAPYILTALIPAPARLIYLSSGMHRRVTPDMDDLFWERRRWDSSTAYAESKFHDVLLAFAVARLWPRANAMTPGWVATRMGGASAPDDLALGHLTQAWLATSDDPAARGTGDYFYHQAVADVNPLMRDEARQAALLSACAEISDIALP